MNEMIFNFLFNLVLWGVMAHLCSIFIVLVMLVQIKF